MIRFVKRDAMASEDFNLRSWANINVNLSCFLSYNIRSGSGKFQVSPGDFVIVQTSAEDQFVGKILDIQVHGPLVPAKFEVQLYIFTNKIQDNRVMLPALDASSYQFVEGMVEVIQTNRTRLIDGSTILDFAYVFHADTIQSGRHVCHGMENAYFVRFRMFERRLRQQSNQTFTPELKILDNALFFSFSV